MIEHGNQRTVYVVQVDNNKDLSDAKKYGALRAVFGNPRKPYDTASMLACLLYTSPSPRDRQKSRMPSSA